MLFYSFLIGFCGCLCLNFVLCYSAHLFVNICLIPVFVFFVFKGWLCGQVVGCMFELIDDFFLLFLMVWLWMSC